MAEWADIAKELERIAEEIKPLRRPPRTRLVLHRDSLPLLKQQCAEEFPDVNDPLSAVEVETSIMVPVGKVIVMQWKCVCHLGSVCNEACKQGKHHDGCPGRGPDFPQVVGIFDLRKP